MKMERRVLLRQETIMNSTEAHLRELKVSIETVANLIYLARHVEGGSKRNELSRPGRQGHRGATLSFQDSAARLFKVRTPVPIASLGPLPQILSTRRGSGATAHPPGKHVPQTADKPKETELNTCSTKSPSSAASDSTLEPKPLRARTRTSFSTSPPRKAGRTTKEITRTVPNGTASTPGEPIQVRQDSPEGAAHHPGRHSPLSRGGG